MGAVSLRLPDEVSRRLQRLADRTGRSKAFCMLQAIAVSEMNSAYGKVMRNRSVAISARASPLKENPGAKIRIRMGAIRMPVTVMTSRIIASAPAVASIRDCSSSGRFSRYSVNTGTKAWENAPSADRRRRKFGIRKATKKASSAPCALLMKMKMTASRA